MAIRYYLAPWEEMSINERTVFASRCLVHIRSEEPTATQATVKAGPLNWCFTAVDALPTTHTTIQTDVTISLIPFIDNGGDYLPLSATVSQVRPVSRTAIQTVMEGQNVPTDWITGSTILRNVIVQTIRQLHIATMLSDDFPNINLDLTVADIPTAKRNRIMAWMDSKGIDRSDITGATTIRQVLRQLVLRYNWRQITPRMVGWMEARND